MGNGERNKGEVMKRDRTDRKPARRGERTNRLKRGWEIRDGWGLETQRLSTMTARGDAIFSPATLRQTMS
jgi:hypothetical protein